MPKIPEEIIKHIEDVARIEDVVGDFVTLRRAGVNLTGLCPFHDDQHDGNFIVRPSTVSAKNGGNTYRCFVCEAKGGAVKFLMEAEHMTFPDAVRYLGRKYCIPVDDVPVNWTPPPPRPLPPPLPRLTFKRQTVKDSMKGVEQTLLVRWLRSLPWNDEQQARLTEVLRLYCVATCPHGPEWVAFWQITHDGVPLTAKYMRYHADGHRVKDRDAQNRKVFASDWEHAWRARKKQYDDSKYDTGCRALFGCHLLKRYPEAHVNIVESEKTALVMANYFGDLEHHLWLACGGLKFLQIESMQPLIDQGRIVWLWPDKDGIDKWKEVADKLGSDNVQVYTRFFDACWIPEDGDKADAADIAVRMLRQPEFEPRPIEAKESQGATAKSQEAVLPLGAPDPLLSDEQLELLGIQEWTVEHPDDTFTDPEEFANPELHRRRYNFNKSRNEKDGTRESHISRFLRNLKHL